jgi:hypothetical protein
MSNLILLCTMNKCFLKVIDKFVERNVIIICTFNLTLFKTSKMPTESSVGTF